jgi:hypothetical protein
LRNSSRYAWIMADLQSRHTDIETRKRHDRLTVRKINDGEQDDNADAHRNDLGDAGHAEGIRSVKAASGPYATELSASSPKIGIPLAAPMRSAFSSSVAAGRTTARQAS